MALSTRRAPFITSTFVCAALALVPGCGDDDDGERDARADADTVEVAPDADDGDNGDDAADGDGDDTTLLPPEPIDLALVPAEGEVVAGASVKAADLVGGPKAEGQVGDIVMANHRARFLIEGLRGAGGYRQFGGHLVDADLQPGGEDRLGEIWLLWNLRAFRPETIDVVSDGRDGLAIVRVRGRTVSYAWVDAVLGNVLLADPVDIGVTYEYRLAPDTATIELGVTLDNDQAEEADIRIPAVAMNMGDGAPAYMPGPGLATVDTGYVWGWAGGVGLTRGYGFVPAPGLAPFALFQETNVLISRLTPFQLAPGASTTLTFRYVVSDDGSTSIDDAYATWHELAYATVSGTVTGETPWAEAEGEDVPSHTAGKAWVAIVREADVVALTPVAPDGTWRARVPVGGDVSVTAYAPARGASEATTIAVDDAAADYRVDLALPALGEVVVRVRDTGGEHIPAQLTFFREGGTPTPFAPEPVRFDPDWGRERSLVAFQIESQVTAHLLPGAYRVVASRGYSWELDEATITVAPGTTQTLDFALAKTVDDSGYTAADMHLHAFWSPDSEVPYPVRLRQAAANDLTLPVFTEHTYLGPIAPARAVAGVDAWVTPVPGQEVSTVEYGHFGAFPLVYDAAAPSGGAVFEHGWHGHELFDAMEAQHDGEVVIQVNHPRNGTTISGYFNALGLDGRTFTFEDDTHWTEQWDTLEVFNEGCGAGGGNAESLQDWYDLNDHGFFRTLSAGSDSHSEATGIGHPRSWIPVERAAVEADREAIVAPLRARATFVSCGPFVRFATKAGAGMGETVAVDEDGTVTFVVSVEAPSWMQIDRVRLLENGVAVQDVALAEWPRPEGLRAGVRFEGELVGAPVADAWYVVEVVGSGGLWPIEPSEDPYALTNAIIVDQDRDDDWTPPAETGTTRPLEARQRPVGAARAHAHAHRMR